MANITKINGAEWTYDFKIRTGSGTEKVLGAHAINSFVIHDSYFDPWPTGELYVSSPFNTLEDEVQLRGDGTDEIDVNLQPSTQSGSGRSSLQYTFTIMEEQNITDDSTPAKNMKAFTLMHKHRYKLLKSFPYQKKYNGWVGHVIQQVLVDAGVISAPKEKWEPGDVWIPNYVPPGHFRYLDLLNYMLRMCVYSINQGRGPFVRAFLRFVGGQEGYELNRIDKVYKNWSDNLCDSIVAGETADGVQGNVGSSGSNPNNPGMEEQSQFSQNATSINVDTPGTWYNNSYHMNNLVVGYDKELGTSQMRQVRLKDLKVEHEKYFVKDFKMLSGKPKQHLMIDELKLTDEFKIIRMPYDIDTCYRIVYADMMSNINFYNLELNTSLIGTPVREAGKFMNVNKVNDDDTVYDSKAIGTFFLTGVAHIFMLDTYKNQCTGIKSYIGAKGKNNIIEFKV